MKAPLSSFAAGALFAIGLGVAGMTKPEKVVGFLDVFGDWDPSLALVMAAAVTVHATLRLLVLRRAAPLFEARFQVPTRRDVDARLVVGAAIFGVGWGLSGYCPGPALVATASGAGIAAAFTAAMAAGAKLEHVLVGRRTS